MRKINLILISAVLFLSACEAANNGAVQKDNDMTAPSSAANTGGGGGGRQEDQSAVPSQQISLDQTANTQTQPTVTERKIIRNADIRLETNSPEEAQQKITRIAESKNGFVIETSQTSSDVRTSTRDIVNMTIRVPAAKFDEAIGEIRATGSRVIEETVKGQDVTEEFIDIEARLKTQRALEEQFLEIMKRSTSVADALNVQRRRCLMSERTCRRSRRDRKDRRSQAFSGKSIESFDNQNPIANSDFAIGKSGRIFLRIKRSTFDGL